MSKMIVKLSRRFYNFSDLGRLVGTEKISISKSVRQHYAHDESSHTIDRIPECVSFPSDTNDVVEIVKWCNSNDVTMIPYGTGSGLEGGVIPTVSGCCTIDMSKMNEIISVSEEDLSCVVQPGVTREQLNEYLRASGLMFPVDPGANASLGGMAATSASGTTAVRYGTMKTNVINLEIVMPDGTMMHTAGEGRQYRKSSAGYNFTELFVGSEGTLGVITKVTLRLHPQPECVLAAVCQFESVEAAVETATTALQYNIPLAKVELLDSNSIRAVNNYSKMTMEEIPTLFCEFHGTETAVEEQRTLFHEIAMENNGINWQAADSLEQRTSLWKARHSIWFAFLAEIGKYPGDWKGYSTDVCVPISKLSEIIPAAEEIVLNSYARDLGYGFLGHVGDGNFHIFMPVNYATVAELKEVSTKVAHLALDLGGTCTGEHGVGLGKRSVMAKERGDRAIELMRSIKNVIDPKGLMNPNKILPKI